MATSNVTIALINRRVGYTPDVAPPSFLPGIGGNVLSNPECEITTIEISAKIDATITVKTCEISPIKNSETGRKPTYETLTQWTDNHGLIAHWEILAKDLSDPPSDYIISTLPNYIDRIGYALPSQPASLFNSVTARVKAQVLQRVGTRIPLKLYLNGVYVGMDTGDVWTSVTEIQEYEFKNLNFPGPITSIEIEYLCGVSGPWQFVHATEIDYTYS